MHTDSRFQKYDASGVRLVPCWDSRGGSGLGVIRTAMPRQAWRRSWEWLPARVNSPAQRTIMSARTGAQSWILESLCGLNPNTEGTTTDDWETNLLPPRKPRFAGVRCATDGGTSACTSWGDEHIMSSRQPRDRLGTSGKRARFQRIYMDSEMGFEPYTTPTTRQGRCGPITIMARPIAIARARCQVAIIRSSDRLCVGAVATDMPTGLRRVLSAGIETPERECGT